MKTLVVCSGGLDSVTLADKVAVSEAGHTTRCVLKIVVFDEADYAFARDAAHRFPRLPLYLQPGNHTPQPPGDDKADVDMEGVLARMRWLVDRVTQDQWFAARVLPQLHVLLWGNKRGV